MFNSVHTNDVDNGSAATAFIEKETVSAWNEEFQKLRLDALMGGGANAAARFLSGWLSDVSNNDNNARVSTSPPPKNVRALEHSSTACAASTPHSASSSSTSPLAASFDHTPTIAKHGSEQGSHTALCQDQAPILLASQYGSSSTPTPNMPSADRPPANAKHAQKRRASTSARSLSGTTADTTALAKKHCVNHGHSNHNTEECRAGTSTAELQPSIHPASSKKYCVLHGHTRHSTEECRASQMANLKLEPSPPPPPPSTPGKSTRVKKFCTIHGYTGHNTKECRAREQLLQFNAQTANTVPKSTHPPQGKAKVKDKTRPCPRCGHPSGKGHKCSGKRATTRSNVPKKGKSNKSGRAGSLPAAAASGSAGGPQSAVQPSFSSTYASSASSPPFE